MQIILAYFIDLLIGDPFPFHPIIWIGKLISSIERKIYKDSYLSGAALLILILAVTLSTILLLHYFLPYNIFFIIEVTGIYFLLATKSLYKETNKVLSALKNNDLENARLQLSYLVSRETSNLTEEEVRKALVETISENTIDGIIAPLFYAILGYLIRYPLETILLYKTINTLDSMVGYKNKKYSKFGFFSAKLDDVVNFIPARIGSLLMLVCGSVFGSFKTGLKVFIRDRKNSSSPNAGHPESVIAGLFNIQLLGPSTYFGKTINKPYIGDNINTITNNVISRTYYVMYLTSLVIIFLLGGFIYGI